MPVSILGVYTGLPRVGKRHNWNAKENMRSPHDSPQRATLKRPVSGGHQRVGGGADNAYRCDCFHEFPSNSVKI